MTTPTSETFVPLKPPTSSSTHALTKQTSAASAAESVLSTSVGSYDFVNDINLEDLDITNAREEIDFSGVEANLNAFQEDNIVAMALNQNVNLTNYSKKIENDLKNFEILSIRDYIMNS
eukprot:297776_1